MHRVAKVTQPINLGRTLKIEVVDIIITVIWAAGDHLVTQRLAMLEDRWIERIERAVEIEYHPTPHAAYGL
jgi:hypothetical protein